MPTYRYIVRIGNTDFQFENAQAAMRKFEESIESDPWRDIALVREEVETGRELVLADITA